MDLSDLATEQAMPVPNDSPSVQGMVRADLEVREQLGVERYGTALQPHNGRDALRDLYEELLDAACYIRQAIAERPREDVDAAVAAVRSELEAQIAGKQATIESLARQCTRAEKDAERYIAASRRVPGLESALRLAQDALVAMPQTCRFHGTDFGNTQFGEPRCESCRKPYLTGRALRAANNALTSKES